MTKKMVLAMFGLAIALAVASPVKANAEVAIGVNIGPVFARPAYGYVYVHPRPYVYARSYGYAPVYVYPGYSARYYGRFDRDYRERNYRNDWNRRDFADRERFEHRGYDRR